MTGLDPHLQKRVDRYRSSKRRKALMSVLVGALLLVLGLGYVLYDQGGASQREERITALEARDRVLSDYYETLYEQFEACKNKDPEKVASCEEPVVPPVEDVPGETVRESDDVTVVRPIERLAPSEIRQAVANYCTDGRCTDEVTEDEVRAAVTAFCSGDRCTAEPAAPLPPIQPSAGPSGAPGERGPGPTDEQVAAAVASFCSDGRCRGEDGDEIIGVRCEGGLTSLMFEFTFRSGRTVTADCGGLVEPDPEETAEPGAE